MFFFHHSIDGLPASVRRVWTGGDQTGTWQLILDLPDAEQNEQTVTLAVVAALNSNASQEECRRIADLFDRRLPDPETPLQRFYLAAMLSRCNAYRRTLSLADSIDRSALDETERAHLADCKQSARLSLLTAAAPAEEIVSLGRLVLASGRTAERFQFLRPFTLTGPFDLLSAPEEVKDLLRELFALTDDLSEKDRYRMRRIRIQILNRIDPFIPNVLDEIFAFLDEFPDGEDAVQTAYDLLLTFFIPNDRPKPVGTGYAWQFVEPSQVPMSASPETKFFYELMPYAMSFDWEGLMTRFRRHREFNRHPFFTTLRGIAAMLVYGNAPRMRLLHLAYLCFQFENRRGKKPYLPVIAVFYTYLQRLLPDEDRIMKEGLTFPDLTPESVHVYHAAHPFFRAYLDRYFQLGTARTVERKLRRWQDRFLQQSPDGPFDPKLGIEIHEIAPLMPGEHRSPFWWESILMAAGVYLPEEYRPGLYEAFRTYARRDYRFSPRIPYSRIENVEPTPATRIIGEDGLILPLLFGPLWMRVLMKQKQTVHWAWFPKLGDAAAVIEDFPDGYLRYSTTLYATGREGIETHLELRIATNAQTLDEAAFDELRTLFSALRLLRKDPDELRRLADPDEPDSETLLLRRPNVKPEDHGFTAFLVVPLSMTGQEFWSIGHYLQPIHQYEVIPLYEEEARLCEALGAARFLQQHPYSTLAPVRPGRPNVAHTVQFGIRAS